jgi:hypothetical protein
MEQSPKWFMPFAIGALLWNALGCAAYLMDVMMSPAAVAQMSAAQQAMYHSRPAWSVGATAVAVWGGALGSLGLILRKRWATPLLIASLLGVVGQDAWLFGMSGAAGEGGAAVFVLQGLVLIVAIGLVGVARKAAANGWIA